MSVTYMNIATRKAAYECLHHSFLRVGPIGWRASPAKCHQTPLEAAALDAPPPFPQGIAAAVRMRISKVRAANEVLKKGRITNAYLLARQNDRREIGGRTSWALMFR